MFKTKHETFMENQLCLVSGMRDGIRGDIVKRILRHNNLKPQECMGALVDAIDSNVSCVIIDMDDKCLPSECEKIFKQNNELIIIEILNNGKSLSLYMDDINETALDKIININV